jgi:hypothetical protein
MGNAVRPAKTSPGPWDVFADVDVFVDEVLAEPTAMAAAIGAQAAAGRSRAAQGGDGDLVCRLLRYAVAGHRTALRHPLQHALRTVRSLDSARLLASAV